VADQQLAAARSSIIASAEQAVERIAWGSLLV
jgi:hypothetical protein